MEIQLGKLWRGLSVDLHKNPQLLGYTLLISVAEGWGRDYEGIIHPRVAFTVGFIIFFQSTEWCFFLWCFFLMGEKYRTVLKYYARDPQDCSYLGLFRSGFGKSPTLVLHFPPFAFG